MENSAAAVAPTANPPDPPEAEADRAAAAAMAGWLGGERRNGTRTMATGGGGKGDSGSGSGGGGGGDTDGGACGVGGRAGGKLGKGGGGGRGGNAGGYVGGRGGGKIGGAGGGGVGGVDGGVSGGVVGGAEGGDMGGGGEGGVEGGGGAGGRAGGCKGGGGEGAGRTLMAQPGASRRPKSYPNCAFKPSRTSPMTGTTTGSKTAQSPCMSMLMTPPGRTRTSTAPCVYSSSCSASQKTISVTSASDSVAFTLEFVGLAELDTDAPSSKWRARLPTALRRSSRKLTYAADGWNEGPQIEQRTRMGRRTGRLGMQRRGACDRITEGRAHAQLSTPG